MLGVGFWRTATSRRLKLAGGKETSIKKNKKYMIVQVNLYGELIGTVEWNNTKGSSTFQYSDIALRSGIEPSPITMPIEERKIRNQSTTTSWTVNRHLVKTRSMRHVAKRKKECYEGHRGEAQGERRNMRWFKKKEKKIHAGRYGRLNRCQGCGSIATHFAMMFADDGVCPDCGSEDIKSVIARPRWIIKHGIRCYIIPERKKADTDGKGEVECSQ